MVSSEMSPADIAAVTGNDNGGGCWGGDASWIIILFLFALFSGGWGNSFGNGGANGAVPYLMNNYTNNDVQRGFDQSAIMGGLSGIQTSLSNGFSNAEVSQCNQTANLTGQISSLALNQATNACNTNSNIADLKYVVATEACADRAAVSDALQTVLTTLNGGIQSIKDQMCQDKIDAKNEQIAALQNQLTMANLAASQNAQTATILANNEAQTAALEAYLQPPVRPCYVVPNPNCCQQSYGCGCGYAA